MTSVVDIAHAPDTPTTTAEVKRLHDHGLGVVVVYPTPGQGSEGVARDILRALGKEFRERSPRDPHQLASLAAIWLDAEAIRDLVIAHADRRPAAEWSLLSDLCAAEGAPSLTLVLEQPPSASQLAALAADTREVTLAEISRRESSWSLNPRVLDEDRSYPPVPDVDFAFFPTACADLLPEREAVRVIQTFVIGRELTMLRLNSRCDMSPSQIEAWLDTLTAPCGTVDAALARLRGAQAAFLLEGVLLGIDPDAFSTDYRRLSGAPATRATAATLRTYIEPHVAAAGAIAAAARSEPDRIARMTVASIASSGCTLATGHRIAEAFAPLLYAQVLARRAAGAGPDEPLFLARGDRPATSRHVRYWLAQIGRDTEICFTSHRASRGAAPWATPRRLGPARRLLLAPRERAITAT